MSRRRQVAMALSLAVVLARGAVAAEQGAETPGGAGEEMCAACHPDQAGAHAASPHAVLSDPSRPAALRGCEACHGPGAAHAEAGGGKGVGGILAFGSGVAAGTRSGACLKCHGGGEALHDFRRGEHALAGVACTDCHRMHAGRAARLLARPEPDLCYGCHLRVRTEFALPEHHKVRENVVSCSDCHRPHERRATFRAPDGAACFRCHADKEGPFVFEHAATVVEGCQRCHTPHGSVNRHLLVRQQVAQLCYECHAVTPATHLQPRYRDCTRCHVAIHGSNIDPRFLEQ